MDTLAIFTYVGLVARRMWAKRGLLFGSFLGATLVVALLAIVPLYESSIAAVDLLFTFRQAPAVSVDLLAVRPTESYSPAVAAEAREAMAAGLEVVDPWYVTAEERTLTRELVVIPPATPDWLAAAASWRASALDWLAEVADAQGVDAASLGAPTEARDVLTGVGGLPVMPPPTYPQPPQEALQTRIITAPSIVDEVELIAGDWPVGTGAAEEPPVLRVVIGEDLARLGALDVGDQTILRPFISPPDHFELVEVAGVFRARDPGGPLWAGSAPSRLTVLPAETFDGWLTAFPADWRQDPWLRPTRGLDALQATQSWYVPLQRDVVELANVAGLRDAVRNLSAALGQVSGISVSTALPQLVETFDVRTTVFAGPILAMLALVVAGALYFLVYMASLTLEREGPELALLRTRGASGWQTVGIHLLQSALLAVGAAVVGPIVARLLVSVTGRIPPMSELTGGEALDVTQVRSLWPWVLGGVAITFASMGLAILPFARKSVLELRLIAARPTRVSVWQRYYLDVFLVVIAAILLFELRQRGLSDPGTGTGLDPFAIASPALFLFAGALVLLRALPWVLRLLGWLLARVRGLAGALPGWHLGRNPVPYGRLALLVWLTTGFGAFALTYAQTLERSYDDRAAFAAGSDVRIGAPQAGFLDAPPGAEAAAVLRTRAGPRLTSRLVELLAVRPDDFAAVTAWRGDFGADDPAELFATLRPDERAPDWGVELPPGTTALRLDALAVPPEDLEVGGDDVPLQLVVRAADAKGRLWTFASGPVGADAWGVVEVPIDPAAALNEGPPEFPGPLVVQALWAERRVSGSEPVLRGERLLWDDLRAVTPNGEVEIGAAVADELVPNNGLVVEEVPGDFAGDGARAREGTVTSWFLPSRNQIGAVPFLARPPEPLRILLDSEANAVAVLSEGGETLLGIEAAQVPAVRVGPLLGPIPTATNPATEGVMIADLDGVLQWLNATPRWALRGGLGRMFDPEELWVRTGDPDAAVRQLLAGLDDEPDEVVTATAVAADFSSRPVQVGLVAILFVGAFTGVVLALAGVTGYVLLAVRRRTREMGVLRALGFGRRGVAATFALEQLVVLVLGAVIGVAAGVGLMRLLVPFLQLGESAEALVPSVVLVLEPGVLAAYLGVVTLLVVASVLWSTRSVSARRLSEVLREVER